jgi:hypothetical protein
MANVLKKIMQAVGSPVRFQFEDGQEIGTLVERSATPVSKTCFAVVDLIEFEEGKWIRFGYYRSSTGRLVWASRSTPTFSLDQWRKVFKDAKMKKWFADFLKSAA